MKYRTAGTEDAKTIYEIVQHTIQTVYSRYYPAGVVAFFCNLHSREAIEADIKSGNVRLLETDKKIVGTGSFADNHITRVYVLPEYQGRGYGTCIINSMEEEIAGKYVNITLDASLPALQLYERMGYHTVKHEKLSVENGAFLVYEVMEKYLNGEQGAIYTRRSIRKFQSRPVDEDSIARIIDAGREAPSAKNRQPWKFLVYSGEPKKELLLKMHEGIRREENHPDLPLSAHGIPDAKNTLKIMESAPVVIMVMNMNGNSPFEELNTDDRFGEIYDTMSIGAAIENMLLKAEELDIGSLWIGNTCFAYRELAEYIGLDAQLAGAVALGYKDEHPHRRPRKKTEDIAEYYR